MMTSQLPLHISLRDGATFDNFYAEKNQQLIAELRRCATGRGERFVFFHGMEGTGKSHCLQAVCHAAAKQRLQATYLPMKEIQSMPVALLEGLEQIDIVCIDDISAVAGNRDWERALFNLYNRIREQNGCLIVTADNKSDACGVKLKDLQSRLAWGLVFKLHTLDDAALAKALQLRASKRGMELPDDVVNYILKRAVRDMQTLFTILEKLDRESLVAQRKLTIPFVKKYL